MEHQHCRGGLGSLNTKKVSVRDKDKVVADTKARSLVTKEALRPFNFEGSQLSLENNSWVQVLFLSPLLLCWSSYARFQLQAP